MITKTEAKAFRHQLLALTGRLDSDRAQLKDEALQVTGGDASASLSDVPMEFADVAKHGLEEELTLGLLENEEQLIKEVKAALDRLDHGIYGRCESCGHDVTKARLRALPYTRQCVACARNLQR
jgi:DnaK suppressor protein